MSWSARIVTFYGTALRIHATFPLLLLGIGWIGWQRGGQDAAIDGVVFVLLVFLCVLLHEGGHALAARCYGIRTPDITLLPIGGLARLERMPDRPGQEIVVALAGPLVNVILALLLYGLLEVQIAAFAEAPEDLLQQSLVARLIGVNVMLVVFNMLPAFPLDGGRVLRAVLAIWLARPRATLIAGRVGQAFAAVFGIAGLFYSPILLLIALFMFFAADGEIRAETQRVRRPALRVRDVVVTRLAVLEPGTTVQGAVPSMLATTQRHFPVIESDKRFRGLVRRIALVEALRAQDPDRQVQEIMERDVQAVHPDGRMADLLPELVRDPETVFVVLADHERFVGLITAEGSALPMLRSQLPQAGKPSPG